MYGFAAGAHAVGVYALSLRSRQHHGLHTNHSKHRTSPVNTKAVHTGAIVGTGPETLKRGHHP